VNCAIDFIALLRPAIFRRAMPTGNRKRTVEKHWLCTRRNSMLYFNIPNVLFCKEAQSEAMITRVLSCGSLEKK
jgi:hypothetical protein